MWLSEKLAAHELQDVASAQDGTVTIEGGELAVFSSGEKREVKTGGPGGYEWQPCKGEDVLIVRGGLFGEESYAVGVPKRAEDASEEDEGGEEESAPGSDLLPGGAIGPGEVRIRSAAAGTEIVLRNSGRIDIYGMLFINGKPYLPLGG